MSVVNSICLTQTNCNKIIITDTSEWDTVDPIADGETTEVTITYGSTIYTVTYNSYEDEIEISANTIGVGTKLKDGEYNIKVVYTVNGTDYTIEEQSFIICNIQCIVDTLIANISMDTCQDCNHTKKELALEATLKLDALEAAIACGDLTKAQNILDWLNALLINYNCKNC